MNKIIKKLNNYELYTLLFIVLCIIIFFCFIRTSTTSLFLIAFKMYCAGLSFIAYCNYHKKSKFGPLIGSLIYTFSGFILSNGFIFPYIITAEICLPLIFLGIDKIIKEKKYIIFTLASAFSACINYYCLYILTIFGIIYLIAKCIGEYKEKGFKFFFINLVKIGICYFIGVGISLAILVNAFGKQLQLPQNIDLKFTYYNFNYYIKTLFMGSSTVFWAKTYILPIIITFLPISILNFKKNKENRTWIINLIIFAILFAVPTFGYALNGFMFESNKWGFIFSFIFAYIVTINLRKDLIYSPKEFKAIKNCIILYTIIWFIFRSKIGLFALTTIALSFIYLIILVSRSLDYNILKKEQQFVYAENLKTQKSNIIKLRVKTILLLVLCLNILFFSWQLFSHLKFSKDITSITDNVVNTSFVKNYANINYKFDGNNINKILKTNNTIKITKNNKSFNLKMNTNIFSEKYELYLKITNLKYLDNNQYSITAKYNSTSKRQTIIDKVKMPQYLKTPDIIIKLGNLNKKSDTVQLTFSTNGSYTFDKMELIAMPK